MYQVFISREVSIMLWQEMVKLYTKRVLNILTSALVLFFDYFRPGD